MVDEDPDNAAAPERETAIDPAVIERARAGDGDAHAVLYDRYAVPIMTLARRMLGSHSRAEDVLQDTFVEVIRSIRRFRSEADVGTWIRRIAINKCLSQLRSPWWARRSHVDDLESLAAADGQRRMDTRLEIEALLDRLPDVTRAVVWLHDGEGFTHGEIAELFGKTESFSKSQLQRAYRRLRSPGDEAQREEVEQLCTSAIKTV